MYSNCTVLLVPALGPRHDAAAARTTTASGDGDTTTRCTSSSWHGAAVGASWNTANAHGTSTPLGDLIEAGAVKRLFGDAMATMSMSSTKSATGHLLGAAGAIEAIYSIMATKTNMVPPTLNLDDPAEEVAGLDLVPHKAKERDVRNAMSNSFGFGGTNASLVVGQPD